MTSLIPASVLGQDDWMVVGRTADGVLVYTLIETDWHWTCAPHGGNCWSSVTGRNCDGETKFVCRRDCQFMQNHVADHRACYDWSEFDTDPVSGEYLGWGAEKDAEFTANSASRYLPFLPVRNEPEPACGRPAAPAGGAGTGGLGVLPGGRTPDTQPPAHEALSGRETS